MSDYPTRILMLGDMHGDWPCVVRHAALAQRLGATQIVQVGDFGYIGNRKDTFIRKVSHELRERGLRLWFVDGNHEDHDALDALPIDPETGRRPLSDVIDHLPRGYRWQWGDTRWVAAGGAVSIDRGLRTEGYDWWPQEALTAGDVYRIGAHPADVIVAHDAPWGVEPLATAYGQTTPRQERSVRDVLLYNDSNQHQMLVRELAEQTGATRLFAGHHHRRYDDVMTLDGHSLHVTGLGMNAPRSDEAWALVDEKGTLLPTDTMSS